ncbi:MAG TPA: hypothetical protein VME24_05890 [Alphaproteobacteria bacterium]|nr:hypothetical protein [Alphaproteobacteria bacterium]
MSYRTLEVEIDHGRVSVKGPEALPENATGLLVILNEPHSESRTGSLTSGQVTVPDDFNKPLPDDLLKLFKGKST